jgi:hypothetical protein
MHAVYGSSPYVSHAFDTDSSGGGLVVTLRRYWYCCWGALIDGGSSLLCEMLWLWGLLWSILGLCTYSHHQMLYFVTV